MHRRQGGQSTFRLFLSFPAFLLLIWSNFPIFLALMSCFSCLNIKIRMNTSSTSSPSTTNLQRLTNYLLCLPRSTYYYGTKFLGLVQRCHSLLHPQSQAIQRQSVTLQVRLQSPKVASLHMQISSLLSLDRCIQELKSCLQMFTSHTSH